MLYLSPCLQPEGGHWLQSFCGSELVSSLLGLIQSLVGRSAASVSAPERGQGLSQHALSPCHPEGDNSLQSFCDSELVPYWAPTDFRLNLAGRSAASVSAPEHGQGLSQLALSISLSDRKGQLASVFLSLRAS